MDFDRWFTRQGPVAQTAKKVQQLTEAAQLDRDDFEREHDGECSLADRGCVCFTGCAPCACCTHPGNPRNQVEDDAVWELIDENSVERAIREEFA